MATVKELYSGLKNFWRLRANIDITIFFHVDFDCFEVIAYHPHMHMESRLYLKTSVLFSKLDKAKVDNEVATRKEDNIRKRKRVSNQELLLEIQQNFAVDYIVSRANVSADQEAGIFQFSLTKSVEDEVGADGKHDFIIEKPEKLLPYAIPRTKAMIVSSKDIAATMDALRADAKKLTEACERANKLSKLVSMTQDQFKQMLLQARTHKQDLSNQSIARQRWFKAIRRVLLQNLVAKITKRIEACNFGPWPGEPRTLDPLTAALAKAGTSIASKMNIKSPRLDPIDETCSSKVLETSASAAAIGVPVEEDALLANYKKTQSKKMLPKIQQTARRRSTLSEKLPSTGGGGAKGSLTRSDSNPRNKDTSAVAAPQATSTKTRRRSTLEPVALGTQSKSSVRNKLETIAAARRLQEEAECDNEMDGENGEGRARNDSVDTQNSARIPGEEPLTSDDAVSALEAETAPDGENNANSAANQEEAAVVAEGTVDSVSEIVAATGADTLTAGDAETTTAD